MVEYELIDRPFPSSFAGNCVVEPDHRIRRGDYVSRVQRADNPMLVVRGVACRECTRTLPRSGE